MQCESCVLTGQPEASGQRSPPPPLLPLSCGLQFFMRILIPKALCHLLICAAFEFPASQLCRSRALGLMLRVPLLGLSAPPHTQWAVGCGRGKWAQQHVAETRQGCCSKGPGFSSPVVLQIQSLEPTDHAHAWTSPNNLMSQHFNAGGWSLQSVL